MNLVDVIALFIVVIGIVQGCFRRLSGELSHLISVVAAFVAGMFAFRPLGIWLVEHTRLTEKSAHVTAFIAVIVASLVLMALIRILLRRIMRVIIEEQVDRTLGGFAGFLRASVFVLVVFVIMNMWPHEYLNRIFGEESMIGRTVKSCMPVLQEAVESGKNSLEEAKQKDLLEKDRED